MKLVIDIPEEDYKYLKSHNENGLYNVILNGKPIEQEPCEDCISRKEFIKRYREWHYSEYGCKPSYDTIAIMLANSMPSVKQEPNTKNDLGVDCISREKALVAIRNLYPGMPRVDFNGSLRKWVDKYKPYIECDDAIKELPSVTPQEPRWIPVSEMLPEEGQWVMVTFGGKIAVCLAQDNGGTLREVTSLISKNATEIWLYPEPEFGDGYSAWMPLPKPYSEVSE